MRLIGWLVGLRKRNSPLLFNGLPCVRDRLEAVDTPLKRIKKSQNARRKLFLFSVAICRRTSPIESKQARTSVIKH